MVGVFILILSRPWHAESGSNRFCENGEGGTGGFHNGSWEFEPVLPLRHEAQLCSYREDKRANPLGDRFSASRLSVGIFGVVI